MGFWKGPVWSRYDRGEPGHNTYSISNLGINVVEVIGQLII